MTETFNDHRSAQSTAYDTPTLECDLVMKGGVTSGMVYPHAILELAKKYRFRSIGGTSAGAIAAGFAAAAEFSRTVRGDPRGFERMETLCNELPERLGSLFQPSPPFAALMRFLLKAQASKSVWGVLNALLLSFWFRLCPGAILGGGLMALLEAGLAGIILGGIVGGAAALGLFVFDVVTQKLKQHGFGMCTGLTQKGFKDPALTDWLHKALQKIAFDDADHPVPFNFGHLTAGVDTGPQIVLRMVTTNLSMFRPHQLPTLGLSCGFAVTEWRRLFPSDVMTWLESQCPNMKRVSGARQFPKPDRLPVVVAIRMSLSFPVLFCTVPLLSRDIESARIAKMTSGSAEIKVRSMLFSDGGLSSNFPIHMFDALLPTRPTFALSLDALPLNANPGGERVFIPKSAKDGYGLPIHPIPTLSAFLMSILNSAKDWQDQLLSLMPGQRDRIARVYLSPEEGGLNLNMDAGVSTRLMGYGREVGTRFANGALNFDEHRWIRSLNAYDHLEDTTVAMEDVWTGKGFDQFAADYFSQAKSYRRVTKTDRKNIRLRLAGFAVLGNRFLPKISKKKDKFPKPAGRLGIRPNV